MKEDKFTMAESERKYEDIARKLATMEGELERSLDRCTTGKMAGNIEMKYTNGNSVGTLLKLLLQPFILQIFRREKDS